VSPTGASTNSGQLEVGSGGIDDSGARIAIEDLEAAGELSNHVAGQMPSTASYGDSLE
tara:strand:+ start:186 stop:359 length:174 start_codon:yes stop_codon:yes gene_type:complete